MTEFNVPKGYALTGHCDLNYENSNRFLADYCGRCAKSDGCGIQEGMRLAMGNNYPYGHQSLTVARRDHLLDEELENDVEPIDLLRQGERLHLDEIVICAEYIDPQLEFDFAANR
jgi:hypothetical protein